MAGGGPVEELVTQRLRELSGAELYRDNAFRIVGLPATADRRTVRARRRQLTAVLAVGADLPAGATEPEAVRAALDRLDDPRRLVDEVFAEWGEPQGCACPAALHEAHDRAVRTHAEALGADRDGADDGRWDETTRAWSAVLIDPSFTAHVRHRAAALDDDRVDPALADLLRDGVGPVLVDATLARAVELVDDADDDPDDADDAADAADVLVHAARSFPVPDHVVDDHLHRALEPRVAGIETLLGDVRAELQEERFAAAALVVDTVAPALDRLDALAPPARDHRTAALHDTAANLLNNAAVGLWNDAGTPTATAVLDWLDDALDMVVGDEARRPIVDNRDSIDRDVSGLDTLRFRIDLLVAQGRVAEARRILREVRAQVAGTPLVADIDEMDARIASGRRAAARPPRTPAASGPAGGRPAADRRMTAGTRSANVRDARTVAVLLVLLACVLWFFHHGSPAPAPAPAPLSLTSPRAADNAPVGTCIALAEQWATGSVPAGDACTAPHWGEVVGYPSLGPGGPGAYPGDDQVAALAAFECGRLAVARATAEHAPADFYGVTSPRMTAQGVAHDPQPDVVTTCVVARRDGVPLEATRRDRPLPQPTEATAVPMALFATAVADDAPVGSCVRDTVADDAFAAFNAPVPVVRCATSHWAEVLGYAHLFTSDQTWPGDSAVNAAATTACGRVAGARALPPAYSIRTIWPAQDWWKDPSQNIYATCLAVRTDGTSSSGPAR